MTRVTQLKQCFVEFIPDEIDDATLYISMEYGTVRHKCCCGCGEHVVTPLSPTDWKLTFDGETISLHPSIGNWSFDCRSHYWIRNGRVTWAPQWTQSQIDAGRRADQFAKRAQHEESTGRDVLPDSSDELADPTDPAGDRLFARIVRWFGG